VNLRTNQRPTGRAPSLVVALVSILCGSGCSNTSVDVLTLRDAAGGGAADDDGAPDADSVDASFDGSGGNGCLSLGANCSFAAECCSLSCPTSADQRCATGPLCAPAGGSCASNADCCANRCESNVCLGVIPPACLPAGERCSSAAECCGALCLALDSGGTRCALSGTCRPLGETCGRHSDCCSSHCGGPDPRGVQICVENATSGRVQRAAQKPNDALCPDSR
jgi:hypothetical protein